MIPFLQFIENIDRDKENYIEELKKKHQEEVL
jgi:hypothetical protein